MQGWIAPLNGLAAALHAAQAIAVIALAAWMDRREGDGPLLFQGGRIPLYRAATLFNVSSSSATTTTDLRPYGALDVRALIAAFFGLSALAQGAAALLWRGRSGRARFLEYSVTAAVMVLAIAAEAGIRDAYTLAGQFVLVWATMLLGLAAESVQLAYAAPHAADADAWLWVAPHAVGWATCLTAYAPILDVFLLNATATAGYGQPPDFVRVLVFLQFALFMAFGVVQVVALTQRTLVARRAGYAPLHYWQSLARGRTASMAELEQAVNTDAQLALIDDAAELAYIALSLAAKTLLGWIVLSPLLA